MATDEIDLTVFLPLVCKLSIKWGADPKAVRDSLQFSDGCAGLVKARRDFDPTRGVKFITLAWRYIEHEVETRLARTLLRGDVQDGAVIRVSRRDDGLDIAWENPEPEGA